MQSRIPAPKVRADSPTVLTGQHTKTTPFQRKDIHIFSSGCIQSKQKSTEKGRASLMTQPVTTRLRLPVRLPDAIFDKETEFDCTLPDYCPDVVRLIRVDCTPFIDTCEVNSGRVRIAGRVLYDILYEADRKRRLRFCSFVEDLLHTAEAPKHDLEELRADCKAVCGRITCKMLSPRHLVLQAKLELCTSFTGENPIRALSVSPSEGVFFHEKRFPYDAPAEIVKSERKFEETLPLLQGEKSIGEVVFGSVSVQPPQVTLSEGSAAAKTNAVVKVLYEAEGGDETYCMSVKTVPVSLTVESPSVGEDRRTALSLSVTAQSVSADLDQYGENRILKAEFTVAAVAVSTEERIAETADDLFSADSEVALERSEITVPQLADISDRSFTVDLRFAPDVPPFSAIYDADARVGRIRASAGDGGVEIEGTLTLSVLGDGADGIQERDYAEEFKQFIPVDLPRNHAGVMCEVTPFEVMPTLHSDGSVSARVICSARVFVYTEEKECFLSGAAASAPLPEEAEPYTVAYFFPAGTDTLWSVAKRYRVDPKRIEADNPGAFAGDGQLVSGTKTVIVRKA